MSTEIRGRREKKEGDEEYGNKRKGWGRKREIREIGRGRGEKEERIRLISLAVSSRCECVCVCVSLI